MGRKNFVAACGVKQKFFCPGEALAPCSVTSPQSYCHRGKGEALSSCLAASVGVNAVRQRGLPLLMEVQGACSLLGARGAKPPDTPR